MDLLNKEVIHKVFGEGRVVKCSDSYVKIDFPSGNKKFVFPDAFGKFLKLNDKKTASVVNKMVQQKKKEEEELKAKKIKKSQAIQKEKRQRVLEEERRAKRSKNRAIHPRSQSVFWCKNEELDSIFTDWNVFTGVIKSGEKNGQAKPLAQIGKNSACLITVRDADKPEEDRRIMGVFMVHEDFNSKRCEDGYIPAHSEYRIHLSEEEAEKMLFWNYYVNKRYPDKMTWNTGRHRYFDNIWMAQILNDIVLLKKQPQELEGAQEFFDHFCQMNRIEKDELPKPEGALKQAS